MKLSRVHHVAIICSDYQKARHFYVDLLGFEVIREVFRESRNDYIITLALDDLEIELFVMKDHPKRPSYPEAYGLRHLAFHVEDIDAAVAELAQKGVVCEPIRIDPYTGNRMTFFRDPDDLPLELQEERNGVPAPRTAHGAE